MYYVKYYIPPPFFFPNQKETKQSPQQLKPPHSPYSPYSPRHISVTNPFLTGTVSPATVAPPPPPQSP